MSFLLVHAEDADGRWLQLADIIVQPTQRTVAAADKLAMAILHRFPGCALVAVGVRGRGCLLRYRGGRRAPVVPGDGPSGWPPSATRRW